MLRVAMCPSAAKQSLFRPLSVLLVALCIFQSPAHAQSALTGGGPQASAEQEGGDSGGDGAESGSETGAATDPLAALLEVLRDDTARQELVTELERRVSGASEAVTSGSEAGPVEDTIDSAAEAASEEPRMSLGGRIAVFTQEIAETAAAQGTALWQSLTSTGSAMSFGSPQRPAKPPTLPSTSGMRVAAASGLMRSTSRSPSPSGHSPSAS